MKIVDFKKEESGRSIYYAIDAKVEYKGKTYEIEATIEEQYDANTGSTDTNLVYLHPDTISDADMNEVVRQEVLMYE